MGYMLVHDLSIKAYSLLHISIKVYSLLQEVCINCFKSKCMLIFYKMSGLHVSSQPKHQSLFTSTVQFQRELWEEELDRVLLNELFPKSLEEMQP